jgi:cytochrome c-type biogenesis protein CcmH/NrfG
VPETGAFFAPRPGWAWRVVALFLIAALAYVAWRGYQQPELIFDFANLRFC